MQVMRAEDHRSYDVTIWLNGHNVTSRATACKVPRLPGCIGWGWVDMFAGKHVSWLQAEKRPTVFQPERDAAGNLVFYRKHGFVRWERGKTHNKGKRGGK